MRETTFSGQNLQHMASVVLETFSDRRIELYDDQQLLADLRRLRLIERSYEFRLDSPHTTDGHGDPATAFMLALLAASEAADISQYTLKDWLEAGMRF